MERITRQEEDASTPQKLLINIEEAAKMLSLSRPFLYRLVDEEKIPVHRFHTAVRFSVDELKQWLVDRRGA